MFLLRKVSDLVYLFHKQLRLWDDNKKISKRLVVVVVAVLGAGVALTRKRSDRVRVRRHGSTTVAAMHHVEVSYIQRRKTLQGIEKAERE